MAEGSRPTLEVDARPERGTRATRRLRREGDIPGVVYGGTGQEDAVSFKVNARVLRHVLVDGSALIDLKVDGKTLPVIVKDRQLDPVRDEIIHIDLLEVRLDEKIQTQVGVHIEGVEEAPGVKEGGVLEQVSHQLNIEALPTAIPDNIVVDPTEVEEPEEIEEETELVGEDGEPIEAPEEGEEPAGEAEAASEEAEESE
jgi:large subunit ribosomal protein L25